MWIIFEGMDKTGKTTLIKEFGKQTNYSDILIDRGPVGYKYYDILLDRINDERRKMWDKQRAQIMHQNHFNDDDIRTLIIYLKVNENEYLRRLDAAGEEPLGIKSMTYEFQQLVYQDLCVKEYGSENVLIIDTSEISIDRSVELIKNRVNKH